jgi:hypothetical protein
VEEDYYRMIFTYKTQRCLKTGHHDFKKCYNHHELNDISLDKRRDPRRMNREGVRINAPPWRYSPDRGPSDMQASGVLETVYHPERYKVSCAAPHCLGPHLAPTLRPP